MDTNSKASSKFRGFTSFLRLSTGWASGKRKPHRASIIRALEASRGCREAVIAGVAM